LTLLVRVTLPSCLVFEDLKLLNVIFSKLLLQPIVIDGRGHLLGRLAAIVAKAILNGQKIVIVRSEGICISGNFYRNKLKYLQVKFVFRLLIYDI